MILYKFARENGSRFALTPDPDGKNLPSGGVRWEPIGKLDIQQDDPARIGAEAKAILDAINSAGIYLWPATR